MAKSTKVLNEEIRTRYIEGVMEHLNQCGEEVLRVGSNEIAIPTLDEESNEKWLVITFKVPTGSRNDNEEYDGYSVAESYEMKLKEKAEKKAKADAEKAKKIAKDKARREKKGE